MKFPNADVTGIVQKAVDPETGLRLTEMDALANADIFMYPLNPQLLTNERRGFGNHSDNLDLPPISSSR
jgi:hypothetical protein